MGETDLRVQSIIWDFDGVLINSDSVREYGFRRVLDNFPNDEIEELILYHRLNGGLSRYNKFRYFFEHIRSEGVSSSKIQELASDFSDIMRNSLINKDLLIDETVDFIKSNYKAIDMYIVSGSDQRELRYLCNELGIERYFKRIHGSPKNKNDWVNTLINEEDLRSNRCLLIGDSVNDFEAAKINEIEFMGYNNTRVEAMSTCIIELS